MFTRLVKVPGALLAAPAPAAGKMTAAKSKPAAASAVGSKNAAAASAVAAAAPAASAAVAEPVNLDSNPEQGPRILLAEDNRRANDAGPGECVFDTSLAIRLAAGIG